MPAPTTPTVTNTPAPDWVALAVFTQPHGVSGRMKVKSFTDPLADFARHKTLTDARGNPVNLRITGHCEGGAIVAIEGVTRREQAELLRGQKIGVARAAMPALTKPNQYYTDDLIGMRVVTEDGSLFGSVTGVVNYGASDILQIVQSTGEEQLFAFTHATFPRLDTATRTITIDPPEIIDGRDE